MPEDNIKISQGELDRLLVGHHLEPELYTSFMRDYLSPEYKELATKNLDSDICAVSLSQNEVDALFGKK